MTIQQNGKIAPSRQGLSLVNAVKSKDLDRLGTADLSACKTPDNVKQIRITIFTKLNDIRL